MSWSALLLKAALLAAYTLAAAEDCTRKCGNLVISYPFGTKKHCFKDPDFQIICHRNRSSGQTIPYLARKRKDIQVLKISENTSEIHVSMPVFYFCYDPSGNYSWSRDAFSVPSKFGISNKKNKFTVVGCNTYAFLYDRKEKRLNGCDSRCSDQTSLKNTNGSCSGAGCCRSDLEQSVSKYTITSVFYDNADMPEEEPARCSYAFLAQNGSYSYFADDLKKLHESRRSTVVLDWAVDNRTSCGGACKASKTECVESESVSGYYFCRCEQGFQGNPYMADGCKDVDEGLDSTLNNCLYPDHCHNTEGNYTCFCPRGQKGNGLNETGPGSGCSAPGHIMTIPLVVTIALLGVFTLVSILCWAHKQRTLKQLRQRNFEQNGGNLLLDQLSQQQRYTDRTRIFTKVELNNATNNFDESRILGRGGQGTVYKGILPDNTLVAIKKSRVGGDPQNIKSFINEVFVLSQINHRHVVKLLGCCLETEVPLLVYEFLDNGSLLDHLGSSSKNECSITWETRLRIATETAEAISYLHSAASIPIIHRDIKSANILLDHNDRAKVSDFGASRLIHLDEAKIATVVQGTLGYLDPEYLQTGQLSEKSDIYSFGVVLVELLTGTKAARFNTLAKHFVSSIREDRVWEVIDERVLDQKKNAEQLKEVALLARRCVSVDGEERPTMKEVAMELEGLMAMEKHLQEKEKDMMKVEESEYLQSHCPDNDGCGSSSASFSVAGYDSIQKQATFEIIGGGR